MAGTSTKKFDDFKSNFWADLQKLLQRTPDPEGPIIKRLLLVGCLYFFAVIGALAGFRFAYNKLLKEKKISPTLDGQPRIVYVAMIAGGLLTILLPFALWLFVGFLIKTGAYELGAAAGGFIGWIVFNGIVSILFLTSFRGWQRGIENYLHEIKRYGTADFANDEELEPYRFNEAKLEKSGFGAIRVGGAINYYSSGHILTVAGTRAGKGVNLLIPNLLKIGPFQGSWVIVDPKGELAAVTARVQREMGRKVVMLNPWDLLGMGNTPFNPLDILKHDRLNLADDVQLIAETIVPTAAGGDTDHFNNRARSVIAGLLMHLVTTPTVPDEEKHLGTLWKWLRLSASTWDELLIEMSKNNNAAAGEIVRAAAYEILSLMEKGEKEYASIISTAQKWTDFLKSPALRSSLEVSKQFNSSDLTDSKTTVFLIIPADRLKTHYQWLRLVVSSLMRAVIRNPGRDVCFMLDEFYALGYLSEIEIALGSYAGYGVHIWAILQNLVQLADQYGDNWENFISSCSVRHFFNVSDNTTADYVSKMFGQLSYPVYNGLGEVKGASPRFLVNPDELRKQSGDTIYAVIDNLNPARFPKYPYYLMTGLKEGRDYDPNPYMNRNQNRPPKNPPPPQSPPPPPAPDAPPPNEPPKNTPSSPTRPWGPVLGPGRRSLAALPPNWGTTPPPPKKD